MLTKRHPISDICLCRLCGKSSLELSVELSDKASFSQANFSFKELIEFHTRVILDCAKILPQQICNGCQQKLEEFSAFSRRIQEIEDSLSANYEDVSQSTVKECFVELQELPPLTDLYTAETVIKEQVESEDDNSDLEEKEETQSTRRLDENLTFEEIFNDELEKNSITNLYLHLDVAESLKLQEEDVPESALTHLDSTRWKDMIRRCEVCEIPINNLIEFNSHQESVHNTKTAQISCTLCPSSFKRIFSYINHVLNKHLHLEHLRFCCLICDTMFYNLAPLYRHVKNYHPSDHRRIFQCIICGHYSETLSLLKKHKRVHDYDEENEEISKIYENLKPALSDEVTLKVVGNFKNEDGTVAASKDHLFLKWTRFKLTCSNCLLVELSPIDYFLHHQNFHVDWTVGKNPPPYRFTCMDCPEESFASLVAFCSHQIHKHNHKELSFRCIVCSKLFWNYISYSHHLKFSHPSFRQFLCSLCGKMLDRFSLFRHHLKAVHGGSSERAPIKRRKIKSSSIERPRRLKAEMLSVKAMSGSSDFSERDSESEASSDDLPLRSKSQRKKRRSKAELPRRRPNNRHRTEKQTIFGSEIDTPEKLYAEEISKSLSMIHLNVSIGNNSSSLGEVPEELANAQGLSQLRWKDILICAVCKILYTNIIDLTHHIEAKHSTRTRAFGCFSCEIEYGALYESSLVNHLVERHYHEHLRFCCLVCSKLFYNFPVLVKHYKSHGTEFEILVCFICGFYAKTLDDLKEHKAFHIQTENSKPENQALCERVLDKFSQGIESNTFNMEISSYERNSDGTVTPECQQRFIVDWNFAQYQCRINGCLGNFSNPFELFVHLRLKHPKEQEQQRKIYSCNTCLEKKEFSGMHYFFNHAAEFHFESLRFTCVVCSRLFWNYLSLANHYKNVHPSFTSVFCCHCGKLFHSITSAAIHFRKIMIMLTDEEKKLKKEGRLENEETNHICHVCGKACKNNYTLVKHIATHEEPDPAKMLQCHICSKLFNTKNKLTQHMVGHNNLRKWKCKICGMSFNFKKLLQMHTRAVHENERSFSCTFCDKKFFKKYDLTVHVRLHTGDFPYACPVAECDAKYPAWSNLFKHCQSRHKLDIRSEGYKKLRASEKAGTSDQYISE